jgi:hypothetical protein
MATAELDLSRTSVTPAEIDCRIASSIAEREAAFELVYEAYLCSGLGEPNPWELRVTPYHLLPTTEVFIAVHRGEVVLTYTLVVDGDLGVPMESVYGPEVNELRRAGVRFAEASCLADRRELLNGSFLPVFCELSRLVAQYSRKRGIHRILAAMHPRHSRFYRRILGFEQFGAEKAYPSVGYRPAVAVNLNFVRLPSHRPDCQNLLFGETVADEHLEPEPMSESDREYFAKMVDSSLTLAPLGEAEERSRGRAPAVKTGGRRRTLVTPGSPATTAKDPSSPPVQWFPRVVARAS